MGIVDITSCEHYGINKWSENYFSIDHLGDLCINYGTLLDKQLSVKTIYKTLKKSMASVDHLPAILHFDHILIDRITHITKCFERAIDKYNYKGQYQLAYPVKSNPCERILKTLANHQNESSLIAFEVGSKAELLAVMSNHQKLKRKIICNGFKDKQYLTLCEIAQTIGFEVFVVIEHLDEFKLIKSLYSKDQLLPFAIGIRLKPFKINDHALKFGLNLADVAKIKQRIPKPWVDNLELLHTHYGSQIDHLSNVVTEIKRTISIYDHLKIYFPKLSFIDLGGGLALNYGQGANENPDYSISNYADAIIENISSYCQELMIEAPHLITESGRAIVSHSSVILTNLQHLTVPNTYQADDILIKLKNIKYKQQTLLDLFNAKKYQELSLMLYDLFYQKHIKFDLYASLEQMIQDYKEPASSYLGWLNLSIFQSLPDHWGIDQVFPIMPVEKLNEKASNQLMLFDISCDKDGIIKQYANTTKSKDNKTLPVPAINKNSLFALFLTGSYQEVLGSYHNLIGRLPVISVQIDENSQNINLTPIQNELNYNILEHFGYNADHLYNDLIDHLAKSDNPSSEMLTHQLHHIINQNPYLNNSDRNINLKLLQSNILISHQWDLDDEKTLAC